MRKEDNPYILDKDKYGQLALTEKNVNFIEAAIRIDSAYRKAIDKNNEDSAWWYVEKNKEDISNGKIEKDMIAEICRRIDKENSTHLAVSGKEKGDNEGIDVTADKIANIENLFSRLKEGDPDLVKEISEAITGRNTFSFASKFCAYMCRFMFTGKKADNYAIYDGVLAEILPYYAWRYCKKNEYVTRKGNSRFESLFKDNRDYRGYIKIIDDIRDKAKGENNGFKLSREEFDHVLWYYYKGARAEIKQALEKTLSPAK